MTLARFLRVPLPPGSPTEPGQLPDSLVQAQAVALRFSQPDLSTPHDPAGLPRLLPGLTAETLPEHASPAVTLARFLRVPLPHGSLPDSGRVPDFSVLTQTAVLRISRPDLPTPYNPSDPLRLYPGLTVEASPAQWLFLAGVFLLFPGRSPLPGPSDAPAHFGRAVVWDRLAAHSPPPSDHLSPSALVEVLRLFLGMFYPTDSLLAVTHFLSVSFPGCVQTGEL